MSFVSYVYPNISIGVLIVIAIVLFALAFVVCPLFFGRCFRIKKVNLVNPSEASSLLENCKSLSKIEIEGGTIKLTRAEGATRASFEIVADTGSKVFKRNRKISLSFGKEDTVSFRYANKDIKSIFIKEEGEKSIFLSDLLSSLVIAGAQFIALTVVIVLTVYSFSGFNVPYSRLWHPNYDKAYLSIFGALIIGVISFFTNLKKMKKVKFLINGGK